MGTLGRHHGPKTLFRLSWRAGGTERLTEDVCLPCCPDSMPVDMSAAVRSYSGTCSHEVARTCPASERWFRTECQLLWMLLKFEHLSDHPWKGLKSCTLNWIHFICGSLRPFIAIVPDALSSLLTRRVCSSVPGSNGTSNWALLRVARGRTHLDPSTWGLGGAGMGTMSLHLCPSISFPPFLPTSLCPSPRPAG